MKKVKIGKRLVGPGEPAYIVAEMGVNHNGSFSQARAMVRAAIQAGVDAIKFQTFKADDFLRSKKEYYTYGEQGRLVKESMYKMFKRLEFPWEWHKKLFPELRQKNREAFSTPMDVTAIDFLMSLNVSVFKVGADDLTNHPLLEYMASKNKPIILSTGMATLREVEEAVTVITKNGNSRLILMHCVSLYPARPEEVNLRAMDFLRERFGFPVGFSDHTEGITCSLAAVARGANIIEKHFTLDKKLPGPDHYFSADPREMESLVRGIREIEKALGANIKRPSAREEKMRRLCRRSILSSSFIPKGTIITGERLSLKRPGTGLAPKYLKEIIGHLARRDIKKDKLINWDDIR